METGISRARLDPDPSERFVALRRELGIRSFGTNHTADGAPPQQVPLPEDLPD